MPGHEGFARVVHAGPSSAHSLKPGDHVVPMGPSLGTWRTHAVVPASALHAIPNDLPFAAAATLRVNPPTALAMLEHFVELGPGDVVIQNGGNSAVGQAVIQLARAKGLRSISIIRARPDWDEAVGLLKGLGADVVTTEQALRADVSASGLPAPRLGLNCVGGSAALAVAKALAPGAMIQPVTTTSTHNTNKCSSCESASLDRICVAATLSVTRRLPSP